MKLKVTYEGGDVVEVNAGPRAQVALERQFGVGIGNAFDEKRMEYVFYLGWAALHFGGREQDKDFDDFLSRIEDVEAVDEDEPDPTPPAQDTGESPG